MYIPQIYVELKDWLPPASSATEDYMNMFEKNIKEGLFTQTCL
jgi:hypothetical protein